MHVTSGTSLFRPNKRHSPRRRWAKSEICLGYRPSRVPPGVRRTTLTSGRCAGVVTQISRSDDLALSIADRNARRQLADRLQRCGAHAESAPEYARQLGQLFAHQIGRSTAFKRERDRWRYLNRALSMIAVATKCCCRQLAAITQVSQYFDSRSGI